MKTAAIVVTDHETGEIREFPITDSQGLVTFFSTVRIGAEIRRNNTVYSDMKWHYDQDAACAAAAEEYYYRRR
jgi:hypothetical protein